MPHLMIFDIVSMNSVINICLLVTKENLNHLNWILKSIFRQLYNPKRFFNSYGFVVQFHQLLQWVGGLFSVVYGRAGGSVKCFEHGRAFWWKNYIRCLSVQFNNNFATMFLNYELNLSFII